MEPDIREAADDDLEAILCVYREAGLDTAGGLSVAQARAIRDRMRAYPNYHLYVAVTQGRVCGTFALLIMDNLAHGGLPSGVVEDVAVLPSFQGKGIGKAMMHFAMQQCKRAGCYKLTLSSNQTREAAHKFYESLGFVRHGYSFQVDLEQAADPSAGSG